MKKELADYLNKETEKLKAAQKAQKPQGEMKRKLLRIFLILTFLIWVLPYAIWTLGSLVVDDDILGN